jgi:hypothetical protein
MFDPHAYLIQLPRKVKNKVTGHWDTIYEDYLEVKWRLVWFREKFPHGAISTQEICVDLDRGYARFRALVSDGEGGTATGYGTETAAGFADYVERAETRALGRALAALGIGTQFVGQDLTEGEHIVDAPVATTNGQAVTPVTSGNPKLEGDVPDFAPPPGEAGDFLGAMPENSPNGAAPPTTIPENSGIPCGGQEIRTLKPAALAMVLSKVAALAHAEGERWAGLLHALQQERQVRVERGTKRPTPAPVGDGHGG